MPDKTMVTDVEPQIDTTTAEEAEPAGATTREIQVSPVSKGRRKPRGSRRELTAWYLMRVTGVALFVLALAHFSILHFIWDPAEQTAEFIATERWNQIFWRGFDWLLLMTVLLHGFIGVRTVMLDYIHRPRLREFSMLMLWSLGFLLFVIGTQVILTLPMSGAE